MPGVNRIENIKNVLGYAVKKRNGYYNQLRKIDEKSGDTIEQFKTIGLINTRHTLNSETYRITNLGDEYYKDLFGMFDYWKQRLSGKIERFIKRHI